MCSATVGVLLGFFLPFFIAIVVAAVAFMHTWYQLHSTPGILIFPLFPHLTTFISIYIFVFLSLLYRLYRLSCFSLIVSEHD